MQMYITLEMTHPVYYTDGFISPGGFEMTFGSESIPFDFMDIQGMIDEHNRKLIHFRLRHLDTDSFESSGIIDNYDVLSTLNHITEFYVDVDFENPNQKVKCIKEVIFETSEGKSYEVPSKLLETYTFA